MECIQMMRTLYQVCRLVHADLSEYNMLWVLACACCLLQGASSFLVFLFSKLPLWGHHISSQSHKKAYIYTIILLKSVCRSSQFLLDRLGRCIKLFVSTEGLSSHEFGLAIFFAKTPTNYRESRVPCKCPLNRSASDPSKRGGNVCHGRSIASELSERWRSKRRQLLS